MASIEWRQVIPSVIIGVAIGTVLGIGGTFYVHGKQIATLKEQITNLKEKFVQTASQPAEDPKATSSVPETQLQIPVTTAISVSDAFYPSGWMGDWGDITFDDASEDNPHSGSTCIRVTYSAARSQGEGWAGIYWRYPDSNWGNKDEGQDLSWATRLTFWARGQRGGENAEFKAGGIKGKHPDSIQPVVSTGVVRLSDNWQQFAINLSGKNLSHVIGGFCWVTNRNQNPRGCTIYLDDIEYRP